MKRRTDVENIQAEEQEILERFRAEMQADPFLRPVESAELVGSYPGTVIRITATQHGQTRTLEKSLWDGKMTGAPAGIGSGPQEYNQLYGVQVMYWLMAPFWRQPQ